jgi:hypothetical protein
MSDHSKSTRSFSIANRSVARYSEAMHSARITHHWPGLRLQKLLTWLTPESLAIVADLYWLVRRWVAKRRRVGMYEILAYDSTLELLDPRGKRAVFKKRQRVRFLQDHIIAFQDYAWGDGQILAEYTCSPGVVVDRYQEGDRWNILISLRETKNSGDIEDFYIQHTVKNTFTQADEWRQIEIRHYTRRLKLSIVFPKKRRCRRAVLLQRSRHRTTRLDHRHFADLPDGRQVLTWEAKNISHFEIYTIKWQW